MTGIYQILSPTGSIYIGQSWDIDKRWNDHKFNPHKKTRKLYNSLKKYGHENHQFSILHELPCDITQYQLDVYENFYIEHFLSVGFTLLNLSFGRGSFGKHTDETKALLSEKNKGQVPWNKGLENPYSAEVKERMRNGLLGVPKQDGFFQKMSSLKKGNKNMLGKTHSEETKALISKSKKGNSTAWNKGVKWSEEAKQRMSIARKNYFKKIKNNDSI